MVFLYRKGNRGPEERGVPPESAGKGLELGQNPRFLAPWVPLPLLWPSALEIIC